MQAKLRQCNCQRWLTPYLNLGKEIVLEPERARMAAELKAFTPRTTETIERANRFLAFRDSPAYHEIFRLSQSLGDSATAALVDYPGWDKDQIACLKARAQAAKEHHALLFATIQETINTGVAEAKSSLGAVEASDKLRHSVLSNMDAAESRVPG